MLFINCGVKTRLKKNRLTMEEGKMVEGFFSPSDKSSKTEETWSEAEYTLAVSSLLPTLPRPLTLHRPFVLPS